MITPVLRLGIVEGARLGKNPLLWIAMSPAVMWAIASDESLDEHFLLSGYGLVLGWFAAMAITAFAARRSRDRQVAHTLDVLPAGPDVRTLGIGVGSIATATVGAVVTAIVWIVRAPGPTLGRTVDTVPRGLAVPRPNAAQLAQGPLVLLVFAAIGLLLGRWVPGWLLVPALFVPIALQFLWFGIWSSEGTPWYVWLLPMATGWVSNEWVGDCSSTTSPCDLQLSGFDRVTPWWHAAYLLALALLLVTIAVALDGGHRTKRWVIGAGIVTIGLGTIQVLTFERWST